MPPSSIAYLNYGMGPGPVASPVTEPATGIANGSITPDGTSKLSAENPMLWLVGIAGITLGLIAVNTSIKVGPIKASASI